MYRKDEIIKELKNIVNPMINDRNLYLKKYLETKNEYWIKKAHDTSYDEEKYSKLAKELLILDPSNARSTFFKIWQPKLADDFDEDYIDGEL